METFEVSLLKTKGIPASNALNCEGWAKPGERVKDVRFTEDTMAVDLIDGRTIIVPLAWYPKLFEATPDERGNWKISGAGYGIHWPDVDEDLSTEGLLRGAPAAPEPLRIRA